MMNNGMGNPMQLIQMLQNSSNPQQAILQMAQCNPSIQRAMQIINGRSPQQIFSMAQQMAQQHGQDLNQLAQQLNIRLPK